MSRAAFLIRHWFCSTELIEFGGHRRIGTAVVESVKRETYSMDHKASKPPVIEGTAAPEFHEVRREFERNFVERVSRVLPVQSITAARKCSISGAESAVR